jgi:hypothetical protein
MKARNKKHKIELQSDVYDPEALTILFSIITALTPIGVLIVGKHIDISRENKRRSQNIRNALFSATRALNETERILNDFRSYLVQQDLLDKDVRLGGASFVGDYSVISDIKNLYKDSYNSGRKLNDAMIELSRLLDGDDFKLIRNASGSMDDVFQQTLSFKKYKDFVRTAGKLIQETRNLITILGKGYEFNPNPSLN